MTTHLLQPLIVKDFTAAGDGGGDNQALQLEWRGPGAPPPLAELTAAGLTCEAAPGTDAWQRTHYGFRNDNAHFYAADDVRGDFVLATTVTVEARRRFDQAGLMVRLSPSCWLKTSVEHGGGGRPCQLGVVVTNAGWSDWSTMDIDAAHARTIALRVRREGADYIVEACVPRAAAAAAAATAAPLPPPPVVVGSGEPASPAGEWSQLRIAHLFEDGSLGGVSADGEDNVALGAKLAALAETNLVPCSGVQAGLYLCSPKPAGMYLCSPKPAEVEGGAFEATFAHLTLLRGRIAGLM